MLLCRKTGEARRGCILAHDPLGRVAAAEAFKASAAGSCEPLRIRVHDAYDLCVGLP